MLDIMLLVADADAGSDARLQSAREVASDPTAPRRALVAMPGDRAAPPHDYVGAILTDPPGQLHSSPASSRVWQEQRVPPSPSQRPDALTAVAAGLSGAHPEDPLSELPTVHRLAAYDALPPSDRTRWDEAFRAISRDWIEATVAEFRGDETAAQAGGWEQQVAVFHTTSGGLLLICAADENADYVGVSAWFESALFVLGEVAGAAGFREPTSLDVR